MENKNQKEVNGYGYADGYRDRTMHPTKGITDVKTEAKKKLAALKNKIK